jgi:hypothetical protein
MENSNELDIEGLAQKIIDLLKGLTAKECNKVIYRVLDKIKEVAKIP